MKKLIGVLMLLFVASGFVMAQAAVTNNNCTIEWVEVAGKANIRLTNNNDKAQTVQYMIAGKDTGNIDVPAKTVVTIPYAGTNVKGALSLVKVGFAAKPKPLPEDKGITSAPVGAVTPAPTPAAATPAKK
jgi:P pilus assembly chaperone PapD